MGFEDKISEHYILEFPGFRNKSIVKFGFGVIYNLEETLIEFKISGRILIIVDPVFLTMEFFPAILNSLKRNYEVHIYSNVEPEPNCEGIEAIKNFIDLKLIDTVIGIGGGSVIDSAKFAAILGKNDTSIRGILDNPNTISGSLPLILIPTTSGTGSEISPYIVISDNGKKHFINSKYVYANYALIDPGLTLSMPSKLTAYTGLDALTHAVEGMIGTDNPYTRALALEVVKLVFKYLPRAVENGNDREARYYLSFASVLGMLSYMQGGGLYAHSMSYILTSAKKLPHGLSCGLSLPYTLKLNEKFILPLLTDIGAIISSSKKVIAEEVAEKFQELVHKVGVPTSLKEVGIEEADLPKIAEVLIKEYYRDKNPRKLTYNLALSFVNAIYINKFESIGGLE